MSETTDKIQKILDDCYPEIPIKVIEDGEDGFLIELPPTVPIKDENKVDAENIIEVLSTYIKYGLLNVKLGEIRMKE